MDPQKRKIGCGLRTALWGIVVVGGLVIGFIFLLRSCLGQWDSYGIVGFPSITDNQKTLVIVKAYNQTMNYSSRNGVTHKSYKTTYYLERVDLETGKVTKKEKLISQRKIKNGALYCYGGYKNKIWVYANYLRAYEMNSLEQVVKLEDIENKNPGLKGKMPIEQQYYDSHINMGYITITAQDGDKYNLMLDDLHAEIIDPDAGSFDNFNKKFKKEMDDFDTKYKEETDKADLDQVYRDYYDHKITRTEMEKRQEIYSEQLKSLNKIRDSLQMVERNGRDLFKAQNDLKSELEGFNDWNAFGDIGKWTIMNDTTTGVGYELNQKEPSSSNFNILDFSSVGSESDKVKLFKLTIENNKESYSNYDKTKVIKVEPLGDGKYLQGGFIRSMFTGFTYDMTNPGGFIIFSKDVIGNKGKLLVSRVDLNGKQLWQVNAEMSYSVNYTSIAGNYLIIVGIINLDKRPVQGADALRIIDLKSGKLITVKY